MIKKNKPASKENVGPATGIGGRRQAEDMLRHSEEQFRLIVENSRDMIFTLNLKGEFIFVSPAVKEFLGYDPAELQGLPFQSIVHPDDVAACQASIRKNIEKGERTPGFEYRVKDKSGNWHWHVTSGSAVRDSQGSFLHFLGIAKDITNSKQVEGALHLFKDLVEHSTDAIGISTPEGKRYYQNEAFDRLFGDIGDNPPESVYADKEIGKQVFDRIMGGGSWQGEVKLYGKDGAVLDIFLRAFAIRGTDGRIIGLVGQHTDITAHKRAEEALARSEGRYRTILDNMQDSYIEVDLAGNFTFINEATCRNLGYTVEELIGRNFSIISPGQDELQAVFTAYNEVYKTGEPHKGFAFKVVRKDGITGYAETSISILQNEQGRTIGFRSVGRDVTERKQVEDALRESERRFKSIVEHVADIFYMLNTNYEMLYISKQVEQVLGYTTEEVLNNWQNYVTDNPINLAAREKTQLAITTGEKQEPYMQEFMRRDGIKRLIELNESPFKNDRGEVTGIVGAARDITESMQAKENLKRSEERFAAAFNINPDPTAMTVPETGKYVEVNPAFEKWSGFSRDELISRTSRELSFWINPADRDAFLDRLNTHGAVEDMEITFRVRSGELRDTWFTARNVFIGRERYLLTRAHDVTERNLILTALRESEGKYRTVVENALEAIFIAVAGIIKFANSRATVISGYSQEELIGKPFIEFVHPDERQMVAERYIMWLKGEEIPTTDTLRFVLKQGVIKWGEISIVPITWEEQPATLSFLTDVTDRKHLEEEQQRVAKLESVGVLAGGIAHDFNNILTSILGNISLASMEATPGSELKNSLEQAEKASQRAKDLTKQLLTFSKGGAPVTRLASLAELLKDTTSFALSGSNVKCHLSIPADLWHAEIDAGQVSQVIQNLVINAQQAMQSGGTIEVTAENMTLDITQSIGSGLPLKEGNYIRIAVADHGSGISAGHMDKIFDPFFTTKQKGTGLGLATSFSIARNHGGHLSVESEVGSGSTFYLYLPASTQKAAPVQAKKEAIKPAGKIRILVMDDEAGVREIAGRMLRHIGYQDIEFAADGAEAVKLYKAAMKSGNAYSVVILDLTIAGGMGGKEAVKKLLEIDPGVKAVVSSGYVDDSVIARYKEYGFSGMVAKPYTIDELRKTVQDVMG